MKTWKIYIFTIGIVLAIIFCTVAFSLKRSMISLPDNVYTVVVHNDTPYMIDECKVYTSYNERNLYITEEKLEPNEYRKVNIEPISEFETTNNVDVEFYIDGEIIAESSAGYFSCEWGGFEAVQLNYDDEKSFFAQYYNNSSSSYYNKLHKRHSKNKDEKSWF